MDSLCKSQLIDGSKPDANSLVCVVIPVYKALSALDIEALARYKRVFSDRDIWCITPAGLSQQTRQVLTERFGFSLKEFDPSFFKNVNSYSRLLTLPLFYGAFSNYEYMLIAQLDAVCFRDDLDEWCQKGYDYVGAPWCHLCRHVCSPDSLRPGEKLVGNGGLSLRRIKTFIQQLPENGLDDFTPEDLKITQYLDLKIPGCAEALGFSVENEVYMHIFKNNVTPMGMHRVQQNYPYLYLQIMNKLTMENECRWHMRKSDAAKFDILSLIQKIPGENLVLVEIGSYMGESAVLFAQSGKFKKIICVDPWTDIPGHDGNAYFGMAEVEKIFDVSVKPYPQIVKFKGVIDDLVKTDLLADGVDIVYIDGMYTYDACRHDIEVCRNVIKPRLAISGHDYTDKIAHVVGVKKAVDEAFGAPDAVFCDNSWLKFV